MKIADFGLAKVSDATSGCHTVCGTFLYAGPEVHRIFRGGGGRYGRRVDVWSLGVILYVMLSGLPPFAEEEDLSSQIMIGSYEFDDVEWNDVSWFAKSLVSKLMCAEAAWRISLHVAFSDRWLD